MHEIELMKRVVSILDKEVEDPGIGDVKSIHLEVGRMRYVVPEILSACFAHVPKSEKLRNARIDVKILPMKVRCSECGSETEILGEKFRCDKCSSVKVKIVSGDEFRIKGIEW